MMYVKLILRNLHRSAKEYTVYMTTLSICIMLIYAFNALIYSPQLEVLNYRISTFGEAIIVVSLIVVCTIAWLVYYISNFIFQKRSKEFGMYLLMGMTRHHVSLMFLIEQFLLSLIAFAIGCFLGTFAIQIMLMIIVEMFQQPFLLSVGFSIESFQITALFFIIIFILEFAREYRALMKHKIYDLLYSEKRNETIKRNKTLSYLYCLLAIICFLVGCFWLQAFLNAMLLNEDIGGMYLIGSMCACVLSLYFWFYGLSSLLTFYINKRKRFKYHGNTMYIYGQLSGRLRSNRSVLATLSILTLFTLLFICLGCKFTEVQNDLIEGMSSFDINAYGGKELDTSSITEYLDEQHIVYQDYTLTKYELPAVDFALLNSVSDEFDKFEFIGKSKGKYISLSEYNVLRKSKGLDELEMKENEYIILADEQYEAQLTPLLSQQPLLIHGKTLSFHSLTTESLEQVASDIVNVIIPDSYIQYATPVAKVFSVKTEIPSATKWTLGIEKEFEDDNPTIEGQLYGCYVRVAADWIMEATFSTVLMNLCLYYFAIIFTCISATILAIQQLSESIKQRYSYALMWRMGVAKKELYALMRKQIAIYFFVPIIVPFLYAFPILYLIDGLFNKTSTNESIFSYLFVSLLFYIIINFGYYLLAYFGCKRNIKESL